MYNFSYYLTEEEFFGFTMHQALAQVASPSKGARAIKIAMIILASAILLLPMLLLRQIRIPELIFLVVIVLLFTVGQKYIAVFHTKIQIGAFKKMGRLPCNQDVRLIFYDEHYTEITPSTEAKIKYTILEKVDSGRDAVYIQLGAVQATIVPNKAFESDAQRYEFLEFLTGKIPKK